MSVMDLLDCMQDNYEWFTAVYIRELSVIDLLECMQDNNEWFTAVYIVHWLIKLIKWGPHRVADKHKHRLMYIIKSIMFGGK